jgi:predicted phage terminase large subunit-like protein
MLTATRPEATSFEEHGLIRSIVMESFYDFVLEFWETIVAEPLIDNWHIKVLCDELQVVAERVFLGVPKVYDLVINVPPGSSKSTIVSQLFPAWVWTRMRHARFITVSYAEEIAFKDAVRMRDVVQSDKYRACFPDITLREDQNNKGYFVNNSKGDRFSTGIGGAVTGMHAHVIIIDDPINPEKAFSEAELRGANRWMETTIPTRKVDKRVSVTILIQQRLHQNDPSGEQLEKKPHSTRHLCIPGELTADVSPPELRQFYTADGLFDATRLPRTALTAIKEDIGEYGYASQILQRPVPLGGGMFEVDKFVMELAAPRKFKRLVRGWDKAATPEDGDYSATVLIGVDEQNWFWILDANRGQWSTRKREEMIRMTADNDRLMHRTPVEIMVEIEGGSSGKDSGRETARNLGGHRVITQHSTGDKPSRAYACASQVGAGTVHLLERPWTKAFKDELRFFPRGKYDDQVDALSIAFNRLMRGRRRVGGWKVTS